MPDDRPRRRGGMKDPVGIQSLVGRVAGELGLAEVLAASRLFRSWEEIVGPEMAARSQPLWLRAGVLRIQTDSAAWASEVRYLAPELLRRTNEAFGGEVATELQVSLKPGSRRDTAGSASHTSAAPQTPRAGDDPPKAPAARPAGGQTADLPITDERLAAAVARVLDAARAARRDNKGGKPPR
ncbi:MAG: DciA family protein [Actinomycetota bacterium]